MLVCDRLKIKKRICSFIQHVIKLWDEEHCGYKISYRFKGILGNYRREIQASSHYRNYLWFRVHKVQLVAS